MDPILTRRLSLRLLTEEMLSLCLEGQRERVQQLLAARIPGEWFDRQSFIRMRRDQCRSMPGYAPWCVRAIIFEAQEEMIGHIGFHTTPDPEYLSKLAPGGVEFGYSIFPGFQRNGYATEAVQGLMAWAVETHDIQRFVVSITPNNTASQAIARRFGFNKIGEQQDEIDGLEEVFLLQTPCIRPALEADLT